MLEQLDSVPWSSLLHAYGPASDVPGHIRALASPDARTREEALRELYGSIFHQGTRYQATVHAIPQLYELLRASATPDKHEIIHLLVSLALGYEENYLPNGLDAGLFRRHMTQADERMSAEDRAECAEYGVGPRVQLDCYDAVQGGVPTLLDLLEDDDARVRQASAYALAWFPEDTATSLPRLLRLLERESDPALLATLLLSAGLLSRAAADQLDAGRLRPFLSHEALLVRVAAAIALVREPVDPPLLDLLGEAVRNPVRLLAAGAEVRFNQGNLVGYVSFVLARDAAASRERVVPLLCEALREVDPVQSLDVTYGLLELTVAGGGSSSLGAVPAARLDELQRRALRAIADHGGWRIDDAIFTNYADLVRAYGLPDSREALLSYLGEDTGTRPT